MTVDTTSEAFFESMYRRDPDPWRFGTSEYEQSRYETIIHALSGRRYSRAFEPGCSVGALTIRLAGLCDQLDAMDLSSTAVDRARARCRSLLNVRVRHGSLSECIPDGPLELIVLSEIGYYFPEDVLRQIGARLVGQLVPGGVFLAAHWLGTSTDHCLSGDRVHEILGSLPNLGHMRTEQHPGFRMDQWMRA